MLAPDQRHKALAVQRFEPTLGTAFALDPKGPDRLGEALEMLRTEISELEEATYEPPGTPTDDDAARRRERLEPRRQVRRLADHRLFLCAALADQLADHDQAGRDADPGRQGFAGRHRQSADCLGQCQPGAHRPLGLVLVRLRPAEVGEHTIAHVFGDVPAPALHHLGAGAMIGADHLPHVLGVELAPPARSSRLDRTNITVSCRRSASAVRAPAACAEAVLGRMDG